MTDMHSDPVTADDVKVGDLGPDVVVEDLSRRDFVKYAGASGDFHEIHYSDPYATEAGNPSVFGQGMLTAGVAAHMVADWFGLRHVKKFETRFVARVWPGNTITASGEITAVEKTADGTAIDADLLVENDDGDTVLTGGATAVLPTED